MKTLKMVVNIMPEIEANSLDRCPVVISTFWYIAGILMKRFSSWVQFYFGNMPH